MPELPEVEVVRRGLASHLVGRRLETVTVLHPRATRRFVGSPKDFAAQLKFATVTGVERRGKYLWLVVENSVRDISAVVMHLGMSGQLIFQPAGTPLEKHLRIRVKLNALAAQPDTAELRFIDQRTFGGWLLDELQEVNGRLVPTSVAAIACDPFDENYSLIETAQRIGTKNTEIKRALLNQNLVSGIGNIYADEALWRSKIHGRRRTEILTAKQLQTVLTHAKEVMAEALAQGGTSFDALYVNVNGESGYFSRSLNAYGREGEPCNRCATPLLREEFMNRSSFFCPRCQCPV